MDAPYAIEEAHSPGDIAAAKALIVDYSRVLDVDLSFQGFDHEMKVFPTTYEVTLVAKRAGKVIGCVCLKKLSDKVCEMKRMLVDRAERGNGLGRALALAIMDSAREHGFAEMKLDTLERLKPALLLYRSLGFTETEAYYENPVPDVIYMSKLL